MRTGYVAAFFVLFFAAVTAEAKPAHVRRHRVEADPAYRAAVAFVNTPPISAQAQAALLASAPPAYIVNPATEPNGTDDIPAPYYSALDPDKNKIVDCLACFSEETFSLWFLQTLRIKAAYDVATAEIWRHHQPKSIDVIVSGRETDPYVHPMVMRQWAASVFVWGYAIEAQNAGFLSQLKRLVASPKTSSVVPGSTWRMLNKAGMTAALKRLPGAMNEDEKDMLSDLVAELAGVLQGRNATERGRAYDAVLGELQDENGC